VTGDDLAQFTSILVAPVPAGGFLGVRPESLTLTAPGSGHVQGRVELVEALGAETLIYVSTQHGTQLVARQNTRSTLNVGDAVGLDIDGKAAHLFDSKGQVVAAPPR